MAAFLANNAQVQHRTKESQNPFKIQGYIEPGRPVFLQECLNPLIIMLRRVNVRQHGAVALMQRFDVHARDNVGRAIHIIS